MEREIGKEKRHHVTRTGNDSLPGRYKTPRLWYSVWRVVVV